MSSNQQQRDNRLIYPEVQAPNDHFDQVREYPQIYEEVSISDRTSTAHSFDSESGMQVHQPQDADAAPQQASDDLCAESVEAKKANLQKWQRKHRRCSCALLVLACIFMLFAGVHLLFPPPFHKMMKHAGGRGPHDKQAPPMMHEGPHHRFQDEERFDEPPRGGRKGGRHLRREGPGDFGFEK